MIVDDEFLLIGSANLNSRSLSGKRDSETCIGCSEAYMNTGRIRNFRNCLWREHFGFLKDHPDTETELEDISLLLDDNFDMNDDRIFNKFKEFCIRNSQLFNEKKLMLNHGRSHIMKIPIEEGLDGRCIPKVIERFNLPFKGKRPYLFPTTFFT